ncbi:hypothetical protein KIN20_013566 [Parelaphostrongylus tenuis]|uniref:Uncharacterized protein n=1 Tax=Parelaphostrongylus tenuis TaxID=148309 RepID=A0AAD5MCB3_PARTN|nr:hypothetical protein KIN20_013566 [Parelaphostrongylus tenuis]
MRIWRNYGGKACNYVGVASDFITDVLKAQGRRAGLFPTVISAILDQLTVKTTYTPLKCEEGLSVE